MTNPAIRYKTRFETASLKPIFGDIDMSATGEGLPSRIETSPGEVSIEGGDSAGGSSMISGGGGDYYGAGYGYTPGGGYSFGGGGGYPGFGGGMTLGTIPLMSPGATTYISGPGGVPPGAPPGTPPGTTVIGGGGGTTFLGGGTTLKSIWDKLTGEAGGVTGFPEDTWAAAEKVYGTHEPPGALGVSKGVEDAINSYARAFGGDVAAAAQFVKSGATGPELFLDPGGTIFGPEPLTAFTGGTAPLVDHGLAAPLEGMGYPGSWSAEGIGGVELASAGDVTAAASAEASRLGSLSAGPAPGTGTMYPSTLPGTAVETAVDLSGAGFPTGMGVSSSASGGSLMSGFSWMTAAAMLAPIIIATIKTDRAGDDKRITGILDKAEKAIAGGARAPTGYTYDAGATDIESMMESTIAASAAGETGKSRTIKLTDDVFGSRVIFTAEDPFHAAAKSVSAGGAPKMEDFGSWDSDPSRETVAAFEEATAAYEAKTGPAEVRPSEVSRVISRVTDDAAARMASGESAYALAEELGLDASRIHDRWAEDYGR